MGSEPAPLLPGLGTPGDDGDSEGLGELEELRGDCGATRVVVYVLDQSRVQLDEVLAQGAEEAPVRPLAPKDVF